MSQLIVHTPSMIKSAGRITEAIKAFHSAGMASHYKGTLNHAISKAKQLTPMMQTAEGAVKPSVPLSALRGAADKSFMESMRLKNVDKALDARKSYSNYRGQANNAYANVFGAPEGKIGRFGQKAFNGVAGTVYDIPRALAFHPAATTGIKGYLGVGVGSQLLGTPDPYDYSIPDVVGKGYYTTRHAEGDIRDYARAGAEDGVVKLVDDWRSKPLSQRLRSSFNPDLGVQGNQFSTNPYSKALDSGVLRNAGGLDEDYIRQQVARGVDEQAAPYMRKSSGVGSAISNAVKWVGKQHSLLHPVAKTGLGYAATAALPVYLGYDAYTGAKDKTRAVAYDQGYNSGQNKAQQYYKDLPTWQRALAAVAPDAALKYGMSQMSSAPKATNSSPSPDAPQGTPVTAMYTRPDGTEVY